MFCCAGQLVVIASNFKRGPTAGPQASQWVCDFLVKRPVLQAGGRNLRTLVMLILAVLKGRGVTLMLLAPVLLLRSWSVAPC